MCLTEVFKLLKTKGRFLMVFLFGCLLQGEVLGQTLAFPGAEGFGRFAVGGRYGEVYKVTNLNDSGPGSFRDAVSQPNRIVIFEVGGVIKINSRIIMAPNLTIAGQTAPGDGVVIYGDGTTFTQASNSIVRYLRVRMGRYGTYGADAITMTDNAKHLIFDHVSTSWGRDENFSITGQADSITVQNSIIAQGLETHSCGGLMEPSGAMSLYRNLYIDNNTRNPKVKGTNQFVNNVVYNWGRGGGYIMGGSAGDSYVNIINNYYIDGPSTSIRPFSRGTETFIPYVEGNYHDGNLNGVLDGDLVPESAYDGITTFRETPYDYPMPAHMMTAQEAFDFMGAHVGATYPRRDPVDEFLINELNSIGLEGHLIANEIEDLPMGGPGQVFGAPAPTDSDDDGIPDDWETANGLDPNDPSDAMAINAEGYAYIEVYINGLVDNPAPDFLRPVSNVGIGEVTPHTVELSWANNDSRETGIVLEQSMDGEDFVEVDTLAAATVETLVEALEPNMPYVFRLKAFNEEMESVYSEVVTVTTEPVPSAPDVPEAVFPTDQSDFADTTGLVLQWQGSENTDFFILKFGEDAENLQTLDTLPEAGYTIDTLAAGTVYYWQVDAANDLGTTEGEVWSFTTRPYIAQGLVGAWLMDEASGALVTDSSNFQNHGQLSEVLDHSWAEEGVLNGAVDFSGGETQQHMAIPHDDHLYFDNHSFTLSLWVKSTAFSHQAYLLHKGFFTKDEQAGTTGQWHGLEVKDGQFRFAVDDDVTKSELSTSAQAFFTDEWVHVVAIRDRESGTLKLYRDGVLVNEVADRTSNSIGQQDPVILGNSSNLNTPYNGKMDEVRFFNYGLSEQEVLELYHTDPMPLQAFEPTLSDGAVLEGYEETVQVGWNGGVHTTSYQVYWGEDENDLQLLGETSVEEPVIDFENLQAGTTYFWRVDANGPEGVTPGEVWSFRAAASKGLVGYWKMDDKEGFLVQDDSDYGHDGQAQGFPEAVWEEGKFGGAYQFEDPSSTASIEMAHEEHLTFEETSFTISMWVKIPEDTYRYANGEDCYLIHKGSFEANTGKWYGIQLKDGRLTFAIDDGRTKTDVNFSVANSSSRPLFNNEWVHLVAIRDKENGKIAVYFNGEKVTEKSYSTGTTGKPDPLQLGNSTENKPFRDLMDEVRLYNYALDDEEIKALYQALPKLEVLYKNGDANKPENNQIKPFVKITNVDTLSVNYDDLELRYWLTPENFAGIQTRVDYAAIGKDLIQMEYVGLEAPREDAFGYVAYTFEEAASIASGADSGPIQTAIHNEDWTDLLETNDYSYGENTAYQASENLTLYYQGELIWGEEPAEEPVERMARVYVEDKSGPDNAIKKTLSLYNEGNVPLGYDGLTFRYWFTKEGEADLNLWVDYAQLGAENVNGTFVALSNSLPEADHYLELSVDTVLGSLHPLSQTGDIQLRITKAGWSAFDQADDHSNGGGDGFQENITVYYQGKLIYGNEPSGFDGEAGTAMMRKMSEELDPEMDQEAENHGVTVYPNPTAGKFRLQLESGMEGTAEIVIYNVTGLKVRSMLMEENEAAMDITDCPDGVYFLFIAHPDGGRSVSKIIKE